MNIEFLNTWRGRQGEQLAGHFNKFAQKTDVFFLHEASARTQDIVRRTLPEFVLFSYEKPNWRKPREVFEEMMAVAPGIEVVRRTPIYQDRDQAGLGLDAELKSASGTLVRASSIHGISEVDPDLKHDSDERIMQSQVLLDLHQGYEHPAVIGGDFNLLRDTRSIRMLRRGGFINLINAWDIETTRNHFAWDRFPGNPQLDADYVFVNPYVIVEGFEVLPDEISDHLALRVSV